MAWIFPGVRAAGHGFRVSGPLNPAKGLRHSPAKLLLDPYARAISGDSVRPRGAQTCRG